MRRQLAIVSILTALSQLAAFFKLRFTAEIFGVGSELDGYNLALVTPTLISGVLSGVIQTGFFPLRARLYAQGDPEATRSFERAVFWGAVLLGIFLALLVVLATPWLTPRLAVSDQPSVRDTVLFTLPFVALLVPLNMACDCAGYILAMRNKFAYAAGAPILNGILGGIFLFVWPEGGLYSLVLGTLIGLSGQLFVCLLGLYKSKFSVWGGLPSKSNLFLLGRQMLSLGGWILPGVLFSNAISTLPPVWAATYGEGVVSAFGYAYRLHTSVVQLLIMSSSTLILARFSTLIAEQDHRGIRRLLSQAVVASFAIGAIGTLLVWGLGGPLLLWLFGGRFDSAAAEKVAQLWFWLTIGIGFTILGNVIAKLWQAQSRPKLMSLMAAFSLLAVYLSYTILSDSMGERAIALALSAAPGVIVLSGLRFLVSSPKVVRA
jgi:peptidoglycan biosynthesis protein MviN/MurJ (putative lipid II flippase)